MYFQVIGLLDVVYLLIRRMIFIKNKIVACICKWYPEKGK